LASCYRNAVELAEQAKAASIAFPAISTGAFGYPMESAARVAFKAVTEALPRLSSVRHIRFVLRHPTDLDVHEGVFDE